jgi:signal transduction histidine kinase
VRRRKRNRMDAGQQKRIVVLAGSLEDAGPVIADLRACGYQVRVARDDQSARVLQDAGETDFVLCDTETILGEAAMDSREAAQMRASVTGVVHDLSDLSSALAGCLDELLKVTPAASVIRGARLLTRARQRVRRSEVFLREVLVEISGGTAGELRAVDASLEDLVERAAITVYSEAYLKKQRLVVNVDGEVKRVHADPAKLKRALADILGNVVQLAPIMGAVTVDARRVGSDCLVAVSHSAEGTPSKELLYLVQESKALGGAGAPPWTGRGLSVARKVVRQHGGRLWVESRPNRDTTVFVSLPQPAREANPSTQRATLPGGGVGHCG